MLIVLVTVNVVTAPEMSQHSGRMKTIQIVVGCFFSFFSFRHHRVDVIKVG